MLLKELLSLPVYANAVIIAGEASLLNHVQSVNIMDAPDIIYYLKPHDLLLTTGYAMKDQPEALLALVDHMAKVGCAGLAIKTKRFLQEVPEEVVRLAEALRFPIIELSLEQSLGDIANYSLSYILEKRTDELHYALSTHKQFSQMIMQGKGTQDVIEALALLVRAPVLFIDKQLEPRYRSAAVTEPMLEALLRALRAAPFSLSEADSSSWKLPSPPDGIAYELAAYSEAVWHPITTFQHEGYLLALADDQDQQLANLTKHAMEQAVNVIGLELMKKQAIRERSRRYKNEFFSDFVDGLITSEQELIHRSKNYGLLGHPLYVSAVVRRDSAALPLQPAAGQTGRRSLDKPNSGSASTQAQAFLAGRAREQGSAKTGAYAHQERKEWEAEAARSLHTNETDRYNVERDRQYNLLKNELTRLGLKFVLFTKHDYFCCILALHPSQEAEDSKESRLAEPLKQLVERLYEIHGLSISIGIGNPVSQLADIPLSYKEASEALQSGYVERKQRFVQPFRSKNFNNLLRLIPKEELKEYYEETFRDMLALEEKEQSELLKTLSTFYNTHCQLAETAKQLFVHRNTVTYRLDKCERLTGRRLRDPAESLRFRTAFSMQQLLTD